MRRPPYYSLFSPAASFLDDLVDAARYLSSGIHSPTMTLDIFHERVSAAMLISFLSVSFTYIYHGLILTLFTKVIDKIDKSTTLPAVKPLQLRPEALGNLLDLIWMIMGNDADSFLPLEELDIAHAILLRWGNTVPWSWSTWNDQRSAGAECLRSMVLALLGIFNDDAYANC